jgi:hypothetical protein
MVVNRRLGDQRYKRKVPKQQYLFTYLPVLLLYNIHRSIFKVFGTHRVSLQLETFYKKKVFQLNWIQTDKIENIVYFYVNFVYQKKILTQCALINIKYKAIYHMHHNFCKGTKVMKKF